jgi:hypothetical protein
MSFRFTSNSAEFSRKLNSLDGEIYRASRKEIVDLQETWVANMKTGHFSGYYPGETLGTKLRARSGHLRSSVGGRVTGSKLSTLKAVMRVGGGRAGYARIQEKGGVVRPKKKRYLTVPLPAALRGKTGTLRPKAKIRKVGDRYETGFGPTFIITGPSGHLIIMVRKENGTMVPLYVLKRSVKIKPRLGAERELLQLGRSRLPQISDRILRVLIGKGGA